MIADRENQHDVQTNLKTNSESHTQSGRDDQDEGGPTGSMHQDFGAVNIDKQSVAAQKKQSQGSSGHRNQLSHFDVIQQNQMGNPDQLYNPNEIHPEPVSAAVRPPKNFENGCGINEMVNVATGDNMAIDPTKFT